MAGQTVLTPDARVTGRIAFARPPLAPNQLAALDWKMIAQRF